MCSFGESISLTPLQLGALMAAIANGGTLYYLQHPTSPDDIASFTPKVKRQLDIGSAIPEMADGLSGAVEYGTARYLRNSFIEEPVLGKTGNMLEKRHAVWLVCLVRQYRTRTNRDRHIPPGWPPYVRSQGCGTGRAFSIAISTITIIFP